MKLFIILIILIAVVSNQINGFDGEDFSSDSQNGKSFKYRQKQYFSLFNR